MGSAHPIRIVGEPSRKGVTWLSDDLIRSGASDDALGSDGFVVVAYLVSCARSQESNRKPFNTSPALLSERFHWGRNRVRANQALARAVKDQRLIIREYTRDGELVARRRSYLVCAGGRQFTDEELMRWSKPIKLPPRSCTDSVHDKTAMMHGFGA